MSNALQTVDLTQLPSTQLGSDEQFEQMSRNTQFLGRLQLFSKGAAINEGLIPPGTYGIPESDKKIVNLGKSIEILPLARRLKALDLSDKEAIIDIVDRTSGMSCTRAETMIPNINVAVLTGTLAQWRDAVASGTDEATPPTVRTCYSKILLLFDRAGLTSVWSNYERRT